VKAGERLTERKTAFEFKIIFLQLATSQLTKK
jgi:hypothetical protein